MSEPALQVIGRKEYVRFLGWPGLPRLRAKIDTGAHTSALGVTEYTVTDVAAPGKMVRLWLVPNRNHPEISFTVQVPLIRLTRVRNSGGGQEERPVIAVEIKLGPVLERVE